MNKQGKVVLVGTGFVGMSMAYSMLNRGGVSELVLIDIDKEKTIGEQMDLSHGLPFAPQKIVIKAGDYEDCEDAQVVVITAGVAQKPGQTRLELAEINNEGYAAEYGYLYTWPAAQKALPEGWRLPTDEDWKILEKELGMEETELNLLEEWRNKGVETLLKNETNRIQIKVRRITRLR